MLSASTWCPVCSFPAQMPNEERTLCKGCKGAGEVRCTHCICLTCSGTGEIHCPGCDNGRVPCSGCKGTGKAPGLFTSAQCRKCEGTGFEHHGTCGGAGELACLACAGIGSEGGCDHCGSSGSMLCHGCFGGGLAPSESLTDFATQGPLATILRELPLVPGKVAGTYHATQDALAIIVAFLGSIHWDFGLDAEAREHDMNILIDRLHFRAAALAMDGSRVAIRYRFLDVIRVSEDGFKTNYRSSEKEWR